ncbi:MAG TPA: hypothetical protein G4O02_11590 [Caldilineae bacterium]|nr:hypothetical protein [Caldilineae bacterium]
MTGVKFAFIGGGSLQWAPKLLTDIALTPGLEGSQVDLYDINAELSGMMERLGQLISEKAGTGMQVRAVNERKAALEGADFVIFCIAQGGLEAMRHDLEIPWRYGIAQPVGDTVGPGGISRALRHIPVVVEIAREMESLCPDAWLLNLTNPMTTICRAVTKATSIRTIGLCHEMHGVKRHLSAILDVPYEAIKVRAAGVNHLPWILEMTIDGRDGFEMLREWIDRNGVFRFANEGLDGTYASVFRDRFAVKLSLFQVYGALGAAGDRHLAEFFPHFLTEANDWGRRFGVELTTIEHRKQGQEWAYQRVKEIVESGELPPLERSAEQLAPVAAALSGGPEGRFIINIPNEGQIPELPLDVTVETYAWVSQRGVEPLTAGPIPPAIVQILRRVSGEQELIVEAALKGDRDLALQAMLADALVKDWTIAEPMLDELLAAHAAYLPQFQG